MEYLFVTSVCGHRLNTTTKKLFFTKTENAINELNYIYEKQLKLLKKGYGLCCTLFDAEKRKVSEMCY